MGRHIHLATNLSISELEQQYRVAHKPHERSWWQILWLLAKGQTATAIAESTSYTRAWIGQIAKRYNEQGPAGMVSRQRTSSWRVLAHPTPDGAKRWRARSPIGWPRSLAVRSPPNAAETICDASSTRRRSPGRATHWRTRSSKTPSKNVRLLVRAVGTAFPIAQVELWATDEHRIGLKPLLRRVWASIGQRPVAPAQHRFAWRYLVGLIHPASGRTYFQLATTVSIPVFEVQLAEFARQAGASPSQQIVLVLDRAGWHTSVHLQVSEHVHLLFLPPYTPELQPAEHLWPLTNSAPGQPALRFHRGVGGRPTRLVR